MSKKILFISSWYPNKLEPTNGNFVQRHAEAVSLKHSVEVLHAIGNPNQKEKFFFDDSLVNGVRTLIVYYRNSSSSIINFFRRFKAYKKGFKKVQKPDLVHGNILSHKMLFAFYLNCLYKIPYVISEHWSVFIKDNQAKLSKSTQKIAQLIASRAACILPVSQSMKNDLIDLKIGKNHVVVGNVVETDLFLPIKKEHSKYTFLHISNLVPLKNADKIIHAAIKLHEENPNFELHVGGDGDLQPLIEIVEKYQAQSYIHLFGTLSLAGVAEKMQASDCFVLFSDYESLCCVLLESMSCGVPVISTDVGGLSEIVLDKHGLLINNSEKELLEAMREMIQNKVTLKSSDALNEYIVAHFSPFMIANLFTEVYDKTCEK